MSITGNLRTLELAELLQWLAQGQKTGALVIQNAEGEKRIYFNQGKIISSESNNPDEYLGAFMIREGLIDEATLSRAVKLQESTQILLGKVLVTLGTISEDELHRILQKKTEDSIYELFNWSEGDFHFVPDEQPKLPGVPIEIDVTNLVLEGAKRLDEARRDGSSKLQDQPASSAADIDEVLESDVFRGIEITSSETEIDAERLDNVEGMIDFPSTDESEIVEDETTDVRGYYSGSARKSRRTRLVAAAAAAVLAVAVAVYFFVRAQPAAGTADRASLESALLVSQPVSFSESQSLSATSTADPTSSELGSSADALEDANSAERETDPSTAIRAQYEAELAALKQQLQKAQVAAADKEQVMNRLRELEQQAAEQEPAVPTLEPARLPRAEFDAAQLQGPAGDTTLAAGGDEPPAMTSPLPASEAALEAGSDFATGLAEWSLEAPSEAEPEADLDLEPIEEVTAEASYSALDEEDDVLAQPTPITPAVLRSRPNPRYPAAALRLGKEAQVTVRVLVDETGKVTDAELAGPKAGMGFDQSALAAARKTSWQPATQDGLPVPYWAELRIDFRR